MDMLARRENLRKRAFFVLWMPHKLCGFIRLELLRCLGIASKGSESETKQNSLEWGSPVVARSRARSEPTSKGLLPTTLAAKAVVASSRFVTRVNFAKAGCSL